jgi:RHS repeat-associated protein
VDATDVAAADTGGACRGDYSGDCRRLDADGDRDVDGDDHTIIDDYEGGLSGDTDLTRVPSASRSRLGNPFAHQGLALDEEIASYQNRARQYNPTLKRFMQRDPLAMQPSGGSGYQDGLSLCEPLLGNPVRERDPSGQWSDRYCCCKLSTGPACCAIALAAGGSALQTLRNQGLNGTPAHDPMRHCLANCYTTKGGGSRCAIEFWDCREQPAATQSQQDDLANNGQGRKCGQQGGGCYGCCKSMYNSGKLMCPGTGSLSPCGTPPFLIP